MVRGGFIAKKHNRKPGYMEWGHVEWEKGTISPRESLAGNDVWVKVVDGGREVSGHTRPTLRALCTRCWREGYRTSLPVKASSGTPQCKSPFLYEFSTKNHVNVLSMRCYIGLFRPAGPGVGTAQSLIFTSTCASDMCVCYVLNIESLSRQKAFPPEHLLQ